MNQIQYTASEHEAVQRFYVLTKSVCKRLYFYEGHGHNYIYATFFSASHPHPLQPPSPASLPLFIWARCCNIFKAQYEVCPKSNEDDLKNFYLLNIHAITVYFLQNRLLVIEYSDSSIAATLHCSGGSLHLR